MFIESLFDFNQSVMWLNSLFMEENNVLMFLPDRNKFVSFAKRMQFNNFEERYKSLTYIRNSKGPKIDPWGIPQTIFISFEIPPG